MKKRIIQVSSLILLGFLVQSFTNKQMEAKKKKRKIIEISKTETIHVSAEKLWDIAGNQFADAGKWATNVDHSTGNGAPEFSGATCSSRDCDLNAKGFNKISEKITSFDEENMEFSFDVVEGTPGFVTLASSHWKVNPITDSTSSVTITSHIEMKRFMGGLMGGMLRKNVNELLPTITNDLKVYAETGEISESKKARMAQLTKK